MIRGTCDFGANAHDPRRIGAMQQECSRGWIAPTSFIYREIANSPLNLKSDFSKSKTRILIRFFRSLINIVKDLATAMRPSGVPPNAVGRYGLARYLLCWLLPVRNVANLLEAKPALLLVRCTDFLIHFLNWDLYERENAQCKAGRFLLPFSSNSYAAYYQF